MSSTSCHCLRRSPSFLPPFVSGVGVPKPTRSSWPLNKSLRLVECHSRSSKNKWKISCFKDEESSSYIPESEFSGDKLPEELVELELGQSSVVERGWVSNLQEVEFLSSIFFSIFLIFIFHFQRMFNGTGYHRSFLFFVTIQFTWCLSLACGLDSSCCHICIPSIVPAWLGLLCHHYLVAGLD
uniref:Uncharacterized protein n=1 Tax=Nelumbo nucifera TaxID=4432 RepID=A0A822XPD2_NELNU|nr:TPA_asm: hypothetical protein HUJ06_022392 [Nelumbo nucifera]